MKLFLTGLLAGLLAATAGKADEMAFTSWGGTTQEAQTKSWAAPFEDNSGIKVLQDGPTDYGKLKAMVDAGNVTWDVVDVEMDFAIKAAKDGLLEPIDYSLVPRADLDPRFSNEHAVGSFYYSFVLAWNKSAVTGEPTGWADMFDTKKFPGKRTFYKWSAPGVIEIALLADGVPADKLYPLDLDRAFKKLDTIKSDIVWWGGGAESQQLIASGEAAFGQLWNGRVFALQQDGTDVGVSWNQNLTAADVLVVPKGAKNKGSAMKFLAAASSPTGQAKFAEASGYAPINTKAKAEMPADAVKALPDAHVEGQINLDMNYWAEHRDEIATRWYAWQTK
ncbi:MULTISPECIES: ABC transporter substrate-binding protein [unclassified Mesorhizobium]|uniref:ABC transporter substrate-binding protein n=1 Tax=unclassified Mesorhizobium TaxID=325217 RepID=UPI000FCA6286|nr:MULTISPECIES: ABC transporter substrate-binding protein [unclassified Mesorhizobium]AZV17800.1 ABC transporter substrate-binding protein [Mesorhizobium sp. M7A.F.Ce.TU.012.03.2.1]RUU93737.1 ABC transporter substrate-binding protein [Mesorhizobium sp. M7A.F.Ca.MR.176.00.0.0]RVD63444.1 ABC transporter substrate-binding protein [Mesorhizobium sp. M7A.F.Ca.ET.027.03.2.1]RWB10000.1 MAG: ABC transporter substrate-binding protein [Mesorhizobium sp.]RWB15283.1 MAG: ABC transporter substrate-binding